MNERESAIHVITVSPSELLVDPNSYRLIEDPFREVLTDERIGNPEVQRETYEALHRCSMFGLPALRDSLRRYGWLREEPMLVRRLIDGRYVVVDGNLRLLAWLELSGVRRVQLSLFDNQESAGPLPAIEIDAAARSAKLLLGARHLISPTPWPPLGAAMWRDEFVQSFGGEPTPQIASRRGLHAEVEAAALSLVRRFAKEYPDLATYGRVYQLLLEALKSRAVREWLGPHSLNGETAQPSRLLRLFSWLAPRPYGALEEDDPESSRRPPGRPTIWSPMDMRWLARHIQDPEALEALDRGEDLSEMPAPRFEEDTRPDDYLHPWVARRLARNQGVEPAPAQAALLQLRNAVLRAGEQPVEPGTDHPWRLIAEHPPVFLSSLRVCRYRGLSNVELNGLRRINLMVGVNNAGKTSLLEAVYLLSRLSDPRGVLETLRIRTRQDPERNPSILPSLLEQLEVDIEARDAEERTLGVQMHRTEPPAGSNLALAIPGIAVRARVGDAEQATQTEFFTHRPRRTTQTTGRSVWLARSVLHSPYSRPDRRAIMQWYEESVEADALERVIEVIRSGVDNCIRDVRLVGESGRFLAEHDRGPALDLSSYGEGLQRIFEIGILFAAHRGGFVLVDELETAIHPNALFGFTRLVQDLAVRFNVQAFITTHSKETVDAFLLNGYQTADISAFLLKREGDGSVGVRRFEGPKLRRAVEVADVDLRRL